MAPHGLLINKLGVQAIAGEDEARGLICVKISLPDGERQAARWGLFPCEMVVCGRENKVDDAASPPKLLSPPSIHPLPLPATAPTSDLLRIATTLLSLPAVKPAPSSAGLRPSLDVSSTTGQVYVVLDPSAAGQRRGSVSPDVQRREWLVVVEIQVLVEKLDSSSKVVLPVPKCLNNVIRFQITSPRASSSNSSSEVSVLTEPKMLPLDASTFASGKGSPVKANGKRKVGAEEGWEDGEDLGPGERDSESEDGEQEGDDWDGESEGGSWLEGRFQSTDALRLEWSFTPASTSTAQLHVLPLYDRRSPSIQVSYEGTLRSALDPLEAVLPDGWGWAALAIHVEGSAGWRCADGEWWDGCLRWNASEEGDDSSDTIENSFSTVRGKRQTRPNLLSQRGTSSASLLRHPIPDMKVEDFSFELNGVEAVAQPPTPRARHPTPSRETKRGSVILRNPIPSRLFELDFRDADSSSERLLSVDGTLVPLSQSTLVHPAVPVPIPFFRAGEARCVVSCPAATLLQEGAEGCDVSGSHIGSFAWSDPAGKLSLSSMDDIRGDVYSRIERGAWGRQTMTLRLPPAKRGDVVYFTLPCEASMMRLVRVTDRGRNVAKAVVPVEGGTAVYLESAGRQCIEVVFEIEGQGDQVVLPRVKGEGIMTIELCEGWVGEGRKRGGLSACIRRVLALKPVDLVPSPNLQLAKKHTPTSPLAYTYIMSSPLPPLLAVAQKPAATRSALARTRARTLLSWNTLVNLFVLWLLLSMGQQVQRLRTEVTFVAEEARDLRMYGFAVGTAGAGEGKGDLIGSHEGGHSGYRGGADLAGHRSGEMSGAGSQRASEVSGEYGTVSQGAGIRSHGPSEQPDLEPPVVNHRQSRPGGMSGVTGLSRGETGSTALGRVVFGQSPWRWAEHPTLVTLSKGVMWLWQAVVWLVVP